MNKLSEFAKYLADTRKTFNLFNLSEASFNCKVSEMTVRNFEDGKTINPVVLMFYILKVNEFYEAGGNYMMSEEFEELIETEPAEANALCSCYCKETFKQMFNIFKGE